MAQELRDVQGSIEVPRGTGKPGLLKTVEKLLELPRVQTILIDGRGGTTKVSFQRYAAKDENDGPSMEMDFETLAPYQILRNGDIREVNAASLNAAVVMAQLFYTVSLTGLWPVALVSGAKSTFWEWHRSTTGQEACPSAEDAYGLPFLTDRHCDDGVLLMAAAHSRIATMIDARMAFKLAIPQRVDTSNTAEVLQ